MSIKVDAELQGIREAMIQLDSLKKRAVGTLLVKSVKEGLKPMLAEAKRRAPFRTGKLRKSLHIKKTKGRKDYGECAVTNKKSGAHAILMEYGVKPHQVTYTDKNGRKVTRMVPGHDRRPFMRPAYDKESKNAERTAREYFLRELLKSVRNVPAGGSK